MSVAVLDQIKQMKLSHFKGVGTPLLVMAALGMVILPMPAYLLDILFSFNIALSLVVLLITVYTLKPLDFGSFPAVILIATILRLALNVASTRVVLLEGHDLFLSIKLVYGCFSPFGLNQAVPPPALDCTLIPTGPHFSPIPIAGP